VAIAAMVNDMMTAGPVSARVISAANTYRPAPTVFPTPGRYTHSEHLHSI